jgi:hypothetical protein
VRGWLLHPRVALGTVLAILAVAHGTNLGGWPMFNSDDEGTYYAQAWAALHKGTLAHYTYWYDHPPLGWLQMALFIEPLSWVAGALPAVVAGRIIMVGYTLASAVLLYKLARNLRLHPVAAVATPLLWGLCPLTVYEARQVFLDNMQLPWLLLAFALATDSHRRLHLHLLSGIAFAAAVLTKETAIFAGPAVLVALWQNAYRPTRRFSLLGWLTLAGIVVLSYPLYALIKNELLPGPGHVSLADAITWQLSARTGSGFVLDPNSVANQVMLSWFAQDRVLILAGLGSALACLFVRRLRPVGVVVLTYTLVALRPHGYLPLMFVIVVLPFAALAVTGLFDAVFAAAARRSVWIRVVSTAVLGCTVLAGVVLVAPSWRAHLQYGLTIDANAPYVEAMQFVERSLPRDSVVLTDDIAWNDLVRAGWPSDGFTGAVWYYKLDRDPEAAVALPNGWRDVDYVLVGRPMGLLAGTEALNRTTDPRVMAAYENSDVVAAWGPPEERVELRKVDLSRS